MGGNASTYNSQAQDAWDAYGADQGNYLAAQKSLADYYKADPYTDAYSQQQLAAATNGQYADQAQNQANIIASAAKRGVADSSATSGALAGSQTQFNTNLGAQRNALALQAIQDQQTRRQALASLYGQASNNDYSKAETNTGQANNVDAGLVGDYENIYGTDMAANSQYQQRRAGTIGQGFSTLTGGLNQAGVLKNVFGGGSSSSPGSPSADGSGTVSTNPWSPNFVGNTAQPPPSYASTAANPYGAIGSPMVPTSGNAAAAYVAASPSLSDYTGSF